MTRGFTLIEVLVALAIVAVGMAALLGAMSSAADTSIYLRDKMFAEWVALNRVEEVRLQFRKPAKGKSDGEVDYGGRKWKWEQEVVETEIPGILRIDVRVRPSDVGDAKRAWYTSTAGIVGDAIAPPGGGGLSDFKRPTGQPDGEGDPPGDGDKDENQPPPNEPDPGQPTEPEPPAEGGE